MPATRALPALATDAVEPAPPLAPLGHSGRWITDASGRVVILHGFNIVNKSTHNLAPSTIPFGDRDAVFLHAEGFNAMRVGLIYSAVEPSPGVYDDAYINDVGATVADLTSHGIFSLTDFHQDDYGPVYAGEGFPAWASLDDGLPNQPQGFFQDYLANPAMNRAFDNFWDDRAGPGGVGLQERYAAAAGHVAQTLGGQSGLLGYDIMNEPWPADVVEAPGDVDSPAATDWQACATPAGCPSFDSGQLSAFYQKVLPAIHSADPVHLAWYEPLLLFDFGANTGMANFNDPKAGLSFHNYCLGAGAGGAFPPPPAALVGPGCKIEENNFVYNQALQRSAITGDALLNTEFGGTDDDAVLQRVIDEADANMMPWTEWTYWNGVTGGSLIIDPTKSPTPDNISQDKLNIFARPYPQAIAGTPQAYGYDSSAGKFTMTYSTQRAGGGTFAPGQLTQVFVGLRHFPKGYAVQISGADVTSAGCADYLALRNHSDATSVTVNVVPGPCGQVTGIPTPGGGGGGGGGLPNTATISRLPIVGVVAAIALLTSLALALLGWRIRLTRPG